MRAVRIAAKVGLVQSACRRLMSELSMRLGHVEEQTRIPGQLVGPREPVNGLLDVTQVERSPRLLGYPGRRFDRDGWFAGLRFSRHQ